MTDPWRAPDPDSAWSPSPATPWTPLPAPDPEPEPSPREHVTAFAGPFAAMLLLGAPLGLLWASLTPTVGVVETSEGLALTSPEGSAFFAVEGWFLLLSALFGIVSAIAVWKVFRGRSPAVPLGLAVGGLAGALVAREVGGRVVVDERVQRFCSTQGATCSLYDGTLAIRATGVLVVWALVAVVGYLVLTAILDREPAPVAAWPAPGWPPPDWPPPAEQPG